MTEQFVIKRAERKQARLRLAIQGPSFSGKTATALLLAKGIVEGLVEAGLLAHSLDPRIGVIDTEHESASLYAHLVPFDTIELGPPYSVERYIGALRKLEAAGYPVILIDSASHEWAGPGGILSQADQFGDWKDATPKHDAFTTAILGSTAHVIVTMRSKTAWVMEQKENRSGRIVNSPTRIGMAPVQRPGIEYEFTTMLALELDQNKVTVIKDRTGMFGEFGQTMPRLKPEDGGKLVKWLLAGAPLSAEDTIGADDAVKALAITEAGERTLAKAPTVPDLARLFQNILADLAGFKGKLDSRLLGDYQARLIAAKDERKKAFGGVPTQAVEWETISPDGVAAIEEMLAAGGILREEFQVHFDGLRISQLPLARWEEAVRWIVAQAAANGHEVSARPHPLYVPPLEPPSVLDKARQVMDHIGAAEAGGSLFEEPPLPESAPASHSFDDMTNDIP